jgi:hypothetical protein
MACFCTFPSAQLNLPDFACFSGSNINLVYMSEFDPLWNNDELSALINPEEALSFLRTR